MHIYYRISDKSYNKAKLPVSKSVCLKNFQRTFWSDLDEIVIIADNCCEKTLANLRQHQDPEQFYETNLGNSGSFAFALKMALELPDDEIVYFIEDDYIHDRNAIRVIKEAPADYWTLYDHPDKYGPMYGGSEATRLFRTQLCHWKYSASTTMTFATKAKTLKADAPIWWEYTKGNHPHDHFAFSHLARVGRLLAVSIPGLAVHTAADDIMSGGSKKVDYHAIRFILEEMWDQTELGDDDLYEELKWHVTEAERDGEFIKAMNALAVASVLIERKEKAVADAIHQTCAEPEELDIWL